MKIELGERLQHHYEYEIFRNTMFVKVANCSRREAVFVLGARLGWAYYRLAATWASPNPALTQPEPSPRAQCPPIAQTDRTHR